MYRYSELKLKLAETYLLFQEAAEECPVGSIVSATENLAEALRSFGYLPSEAASIVTDIKREQRNGP